MKDGQFEPYPAEKRAAVIADVRAGKTIKAAAMAQGVPPNTAGNWARAVGLGRFRGKTKTPKAGSKDMRDGMPAIQKPFTDGLANSGKGRRYDKNLKKAVISALRSGTPVKDTAAQFNINQKTVEQWAWLHRSGKQKKAARKAAFRGPVVAPQPKVRVATQQSADRTLVAGFIVTSPKSPGGLLDDAKSLLDRLVKEARNGSDP